MNEDRLLRRISNILHCNYLSDLHFNRKYLNQNAIKPILRIKKEAYSVEDWEKAISYITDKDVNCNSVDEAKSILLDFYK